MREVIEVKDLRKSFGGMDVVKGCSFCVGENEIYGFLGANGAGKTTIFKMLTGLLSMDGGEVHMMGYNIRTQRNEILRHVGMSIETPTFYEHLSAAENLQIHLSYMNAEGDIPKVLKTVGLGTIDDRPVLKFSLGMRARLAIARAMIHNPDILILDEPVNGLDPQGIRDMRALFKELCKKHNKTILLSSHTLSEMEHIADTIGILADGVIAREAKIEDIKAQYANGLEDYYFETRGGARENG